MSTSTAKLQLLKPDGTNFVNVVTQLDDNLDKIDSDAGAHVCTSGTRPGTPYQGKIIFETDTGDFRVWDGTNWLIISHTGVWKTYNVAWTNDATDPTIGNGILTGKYSKIGRLVTIRINLVIGTTTTFGTGTAPWKFSLPDSPVSDANTSHIFNSFASDSSTSTVYRGVAVANPSQIKIDRIYFSDAVAPFVKPTTPFTWASTDTLTIAGQYESSVD